MIFAHRAKEHLPKLPIVHLASDLHDKTQVVTLEQFESFMSEVFEHADPIGSDDGKSWESANPNYTYNFTGMLVGPIERDRSVYRDEMLRTLRRDNLTVKDLRDLADRIEKWGMK